MVGSTRSQTYKPPTATRHYDKLPRGKPGPRRSTRATQAFRVASMPTPVSLTKKESVANIFSRKSPQDEMPEEASASTPQIASHAARYSTPLSSGIPPAPERASNMLLMTSGAVRAQQLETQNLKQKIDEISEDVQDLNERIEALTAERDGKANEIAEAKLKVQEIDDWFAMLLTFAKSPARSKLVQTMAEQLRNCVAEGSDGLYNAVEGAMVKGRLEEVIDRLGRIN